MISWKTAALAALTCTAASVTSAQQVTHVAKTNPLGLFASQYQLGYEHGLNDNFSVQLSAGFMGGSLEIEDCSSNSVLGQLSAGHFCSDFNACLTGMLWAFFSDPSTRP